MEIRSPTKQKRVEVLSIDNEHEPEMPVVDFDKLGPDQSPLRRSNAWVDK